MITDVLKERKPGDKPRFFLHDEMKEWLKDNLKVTVATQDQFSSDHTLTQKLNLSQYLTTHVLIRTTVTIAGEDISHQFNTISLHEHEKAFKTLSRVVESCMQQINQLHAENEELRKRIELLENPIPV